MGGVRNAQYDIPLVSREKFKSSQTLKKIIIINELLFYIPILESEDSTKASPQKVATEEPKEMVNVRLKIMFMFII